jgi:branched-chain amino acid aminotransferase
VHIFLSLWVSCHDPCQKKFQIHSDEKKKKSGECIEEAGASNFFAIFPGNKILTPSLDSETILPGVTRASIIELARTECGMDVVEGTVTLKDLEHATEAFCCGTGASITPVGSIHVTNRQKNDDDDNDQYNNDTTNHATEVVFGDGRFAGPITHRLYDLLLKIQTGTEEELNQKYGHWIHTVDP